MYLLKFDDILYLDNYNTLPIQSFKLMSSEELNIFKTNINSLKRPKIYIDEDYSITYFSPKEYLSHITIKKLSKVEAQNITNILGEEFGNPGMFILEEGLL